MYDDCSFAPGADVPFYCHGIFLGQNRVHTKASVPQVPAVVSVLPTQIRIMIVVEVFREHAIGRIVLDFSAVLNGAESLRIRSSASRHQLTQGLLCLSGDDVDHTIYCIGAPYRPARSANHRDSFNVLQRHVLRVPIHASKKRRVNSSAINKHKQFAGELKIEAPCGDRPGVRIDLGHIHSGYHAQKIRNVGCPRARDILGGNHENRRRHLRQLLLLLRN